MINNCFCRTHILIANFLVSVKGLYSAKEEELVSIIFIVAAATIAVNSYLVASVVFAALLDFLLTLFCGQTPDFL